MRITFITPSYAPYIGGVEKHVEGIVKVLSKNHQVTIVTEQKDAKAVGYEKKNNLEIYRIPTYDISEKNKKWRIWSWILKNHELLNNSDVIHVHDVMYWLYPYKLLHPLKKVYITFHGWEGIYPIPLKNIILHKLNEFLAAGNICVGDFIAKWYYTRPDTVTYGAVEVPVYRPKVISKSLLFIGRLAEDTGFRECLDLGWPLVVVGDGPLKYLLPKNANFLGFVPHPEKYIAAANHVYASGYLTILESFVQNKIVLASYSNPVRRDYLTMHPMGKFLGLNGDIPKVASQAAYNWAQDQTWAKLVSQYQSIWQK
ncbi:MAG: glycosyltransferase family 4 protein [Patescibacteria group bacterium]